MKVKRKGHSERKTPEPGASHSGGAGIYCLHKVTKEPTWMEGGSGGAPTRIMPQGR